MEELAAEVLRQMRADDGDLDVWVRWHWCSSNYKIIPTVRNGKLQWLWCGSEHARQYTLLLEDVDDLMEFLHIEFPLLQDLQGGNRSSRTASAIIMTRSGDRHLLRYNVDLLGPGDCLKRFLLRSPKIKVCKSDLPKQQ